MLKKDTKEIDPLTEQKGAWKWGVLIAVVLYGFVFYQYVNGWVIDGFRNPKIVECNEKPCDFTFYLYIFVQLFMATVFALAPSLVERHVEKSFSDVENISNDET